MNGLRHLFETTWQVLARHRGTDAQRERRHLKGHCALLASTDVAPNCLGMDAHGPDDLGNGIHRYRLRNVRGAVRGRKLGGCHGLRHRHLPNGLRLLRIRLALAVLLPGLCGALAGLLPLLGGLLLRMLLAPPQEAFHILGEAGDDKVRGPLAQHPELLQGVAAFLGCRKHRQDSCHLGLLGAIEAEAMQELVSAANHKSRGMQRFCVTVAGRGEGLRGEKTLAESLRLRLQGRQ
mmetsp:Transcript_18317/g.52118  ORF Transcript_18317/g.52118 Transcript_18317/m.52118 type:complete len:235 (-) Transcript_18317:1540-2244(-)